MSDTTPRKIKAVESKPGYRLLLSWERGQAVLVDLSDMIDKGGVFSALADSKKFSAVRIGENNTVVEWPEPLDDLGDPLISIDGDALFEKYQFQKTESLAAALQGMLNAAKMLMRPNNSSRKA